MDIKKKTVTLVTNIKLRIEIINVLLIFKNGTILKFRDLHKL